MEDLVPDSILDIPGNGAAIERLGKLFSGGAPVVAFVGAGASAPLYPIWDELVDALAEFAVRIDRLKPEQVQLLKKSSNRQHYAGAIKRALEAGGHFCQFIDDTFKGNGFTPVHEVLVQLPFWAIVTTNYDKGLLHAASAAARQVQALIPPHPEEIVSDWKLGRALTIRPTLVPVLYAHGIHDRCSTIVCTHDDYMRAYNEGNTFLRETLERLFTAAHLVFVGYGFGDPWLEFLASEFLGKMNRNIERVRHYGIIGIDSSQGSNPNFRQEFNNRYLMEPICYPVAQDNGSSRRDHSQLLVTLDKIATTQQHEPNLQRWRTIVFDARKVLLDMFDAASGGFFYRRRRADHGTQAWASAQAIVAICSAPDSLPDADCLRKVLAYFQRTRLTNGWSHLPDKAKSDSATVVSEATAWVVLAKMRILAILQWPEECIADLIADINALFAFQDLETGAWSPRVPSSEGYSRTYSAAMGLWVLAEALTHPQLSNIASIRTRLQHTLDWLVSRDRHGLGWVQDPEDGDSPGSPALTSQILFVLSRAQKILGSEVDDAIRSVQFRCEWLCNESRDDILRDDQASNASQFLPDGTQIESLFFLWFPWTVLALSLLKSHPALPVAKKRRCAVSRTTLLSNADTVSHFLSNRNRPTFQIAEYVIALHYALHIE